MLSLANPLTTVCLYGVEVMGYVTRRSPLGNHTLGKTFRSPWKSAPRLGFLSIPCGAPLERYAAPYCPSRTHKIGSVDHNLQGTRK